MNERSIYLDNAATTRPDPQVVEAMLPFLREHWGNASSLHHAGRPAARELHRARRVLAEAFGARPGGVIFTAGATEANDLALRGVLSPEEGLVTSAVEHPAVLETARRLEEEGHPLTVLEVNAQGELDLDALDTALQSNPRVVSIMAVNNETGIVFPSEDIAARVHRAGALLHVDAVQAVGKLPLRVAEDAIDLLSLSAHKIHGPKGVGALVVRRGLDLRATLPGGGQEGGRRGGTENVPGIVGLGRTLELLSESSDSDSLRMTELRLRLEAGLIGSIPDLWITGAKSPRAPHITHLTLPGVEAEPLLVQLDRAGIACSVGSACSTGALEPSHVVRALDLPRDRWHGALRFSLSRETTAEEVDHLLAVMPPLVAQVRALGQPG